MQVLSACGRRRLAKSMACGHEQEESACEKGEKVERDQEQKPVQEQSLFS